MLRRAAARRPVILVLDDLHAADEPSLLLLQFVARELSDSRILVIGAYRDVDPTPAEPLTTALVEVGEGADGSRTITLTGLDESDVGRFIELTAHDVPADGRACGGRACGDEGNPLFVGGNRASPAASKRRLGDVAALAIPQSVRDVIGRRLRHLSEEANRVLVARVGSRSGIGISTRWRGWLPSPTTTRSTLSTKRWPPEFCRICPGSPGRLRFAHVLIRDTLYEGLTTARRVHLHRAAVEALAALVSR